MKVQYIFQLYSFASNRVMLKKEIMERKVKRYVTTTVLTKILAFHIFWTKNVIFIFLCVYFIQWFKAPTLRPGLEKHVYWEKQSGHVLKYRDGRRNFWSCVILNWLALDLSQRQTW